MFTSLSVFNSLKPIIASICSSLKINNREHPKGRISALTNIEALTCAVIKQKQGVMTKKSLYEMIEPPCTYKTFVESINRMRTHLETVIAFLLKISCLDAHLIKFTDATEVPVCLLKNEKHHKTMKSVATKSKSSKGYYYGLKLHLSADVEGRVLALRFSTATGNDRAIFKDMNAHLRGLFVADAGYVGKDFTRDFYIENERMVLTATRVNMKTLATSEQTDLLNLRMKIETHFRMLKVVYGFITSLPRSIDGYLTHYLSALTAHLIESLTALPPQVPPLLLV